MAASTSAAVQIMARADLLASYSEEETILTRRYGSKALSAVNHVVSGWMSACGMAVRRDAFGNVIGRYEGTGATPKRLILGSHLDTVCNAGKYDGVLGVLVTLACVEQLYSQSTRLPYAIEVIGFADEEGVRYHVPFLGSKSFAGTFAPADLDLRDDEGISLSDAIRAFGGTPETLISPSSRDPDLLAYCEVHIEQGTLLEEHDAPVGVVPRIAGQARVRVELTGGAGHAGTTPMHARHDALAAAAELVLAVESAARRCPGGAATVGQLIVQPGVSNVVPGSVELSIDMRHADDVVLALLAEQLQEQARCICRRRGIGDHWIDVHRSGATVCAPELVGILSHAIEGLHVPVVPVISMAGHDAVTMANVAPAVMLFVRSRGGVSHHPAEAVAEGDVAIALKVLEHYLHLLAANLWRSG